MNHTELNRVSIRICKLSLTYEARFNVALSSSDQNNNRRYIHQEFRYESVKYIDQPIASMLKLDPYWYITIEEMYKKSTEKNSFMISYSSFFKFKRFLRTAIQWFDSKPDLFIKTGHILSFNSKYSDLNFTMEISDDTTIMIKPHLIAINEIGYEGVMIIINDMTSYIEITDNYLYALYDTLSVLDVTTLTYTLLSYIEAPKGNVNVAVMEKRPHPNVVRDDSQINMGQNGFMSGSTANIKYINTKRNESGILELD